MMSASKQTVSTQQPFCSIDARIQLDTSNGNFTFKYPKTIFGHPNNMILALCAVSYYAE